MTTSIRRVRIGDWLLPYDDATSEVVIQRTMADILAATPGDHLRCMNAVCINAQRNAKVFPHPVYLVSTITSRVYIVDRLSDAGDPVHCIRYELGEYDRNLIAAHDRWGTGQPGTLRLKVPRDPKGSPKRAKQPPVQEQPAAEGSSQQPSPEGSQKTSRSPLPTRSLGAKHRFQVAVGGRKVADRDDG